MDTESLIVPLSRESIVRLFQMKYHFGVENFFNIFHCFYMLSNIPKGAQNNPFALFMDQKSVLRGFAATFGVDCEEVAIRFYKLFVVPPSQQIEKKRVNKIDLIRFYEVVQQLCDRSNYASPQHIINAFKFYDYDGNNNIGSVDIVNLIKYLPSRKIEKIYRK